MDCDDGTAKFLPAVEGEDRCDLNSARYCDVESSCGTAGKSAPPAVPSVEGSIPLGVESFRVEGLDDAVEREEDLRLTSVSGMKGGGTLRFGGGCGEAWKGVVRSKVCFERIRGCQWDPPAEQDRKALPRRHAATGIREGLERWAWIVGQRVVLLLESNQVGNGSTAFLASQAGVRRARRVYGSGRRVWLGRANELIRGPSEDH